MRRTLTFSLATLALLLAAAPAHAYEPTKTHAGLTARAVLGSQLHRFLRRAGLPLGLFTRLELSPAKLDRAALRRLRLQQRRLDPAGGFRYDERLGQWAVGWLLGGSVLQEVPAVRDRHHFYDPTNRQGLAEDKPLEGGAFAFLSMLENGDSIRALLTGTGFDLTGTSALSWIHAKDNPHSIEHFYAELADAARAESLTARRHALARALMAMGGLLHVLQDLASPTHVRNDYALGHLQRLGSSLFDRGSAYERFVAARYGRSGLPHYDGPAIQRRRIEDYFASKDWRGLANVTHLGHFSPGTLPPLTPLRRSRSASELRQHLAKKLRYQQPALAPIDVACARRRTCYQVSQGRRQLAYRLDGKGRLHFFIDYACHAASARALLPLAVGFSRGLIDHLVRGRISLRRSGEKLQVRNLGPTLRDAVIELLVEDAQGRRKLLGKIAGPLRHGVATTSVVTAPTDKTVVALVTGTDEQGDPLVAVAALPWTPATQPSSQPTSTIKPVTSQPAATQATTQPATTQSTAMRATQPVTAKPATQPAATQPAATLPATTKPATTKPATTKPATTKPATTKPAMGRTQAQPLKAKAVKTTPKL